MITQVVLIHMNLVCFGSMTNLAQMKRLASVYYLFIAVQLVSLLVGRTSFTVHWREKTLLRG